MKNLFKIISILLLLPYFIQYKSFASDNFVDNNAILSLIEKNKNAKIVMSEYNTGKIISKKEDDVIVPYSRLINKLLVFKLSEKLRENEIKLEDKITLNTSDDVLDKYKIEGSITIKDTIFLLEQTDSPETIQNTLKFLNLKIEDLQKTLDTLTLSHTELVKLDNSNDNKSTARNVNYLVNETIKNFPEILEITKSPEYKFSNDEKIDNNIEFIKSESLRTLGVNYNKDTASLISYSGNTRVILTIINIEESKEDFFKNVQETLEYTFKNYTYKLALKAGKYNINNENINIENDIYDLFYKDHSEKDVRYFLMNNKILLFQNYNYLSANSGTVYADFISNDNNTTLTRAKETFIQDAYFDEKPKKEKLDILIERTQYFATFVVLIYSVIFIVLYVLKRIFKKGQ